MIIQEFPNYRIDGDVVSRGFFADSRRVVVPNKGIYALKKNGKTHFRTLNQLKGVKSSGGFKVKNICEKPRRLMLDKIIDLFLSGETPSKIAFKYDVLEKTICAHFTKLKQPLKGLCKSYKIDYEEVKALYLQEVKDSELDQEDRLRIIQRQYLRNLPYAEKCRRHGVTYDQLTAYINYNNDKLTRDNFDHWVKVYKREVKGVE